LIVIAVAMAAAGLLCWLLSRRIPIAVTHLALAGAAAATGLLFWKSGVAAGQYGSIFVWATWSPPTSFRVASRSPTSPGCSLSTR